MRSLGLLFESLVVRDLRVYCQAGDIAVFHHQAQRGGELDAVLEARDGRWVAVEVKLGGNEQMLDEAAAKLAGRDPQYRHLSQAASCGAPHRDSVRHRRLPATRRRHRRTHHRARPVVRCP